MLSIIEEMRNGAAGEDDVKYLRDSLNRQDLRQQPIGDAAPQPAEEPTAPPTGQQQAAATATGNAEGEVSEPSFLETVVETVAGTDPIATDARDNPEDNAVVGARDPEIRAALDEVETTIRNTPVESNVSGDQTIVPKAEALHLFKSYESAMRNAARPICTLEEYVAFLGEYGVRHGRVTPATALLQGDPRAFPATYYVRIRHYTPGPPPLIPVTDITNTDVVTGLDGVDSTHAQEEIRADAATGVISATPTPAPVTSSDANPGEEQAAATATGNAEGEVSEPSFIETGIETVIGVDPAATDALDGTTDTSDTSDTAGTTVNPEGGVVHGLPDDFPQNRANWNAVLLQYRINALTKLPPRT